MQVGHCKAGRRLATRRVWLGENDVAVHPNVESVSGRNFDGWLYIEVSPSDLRPKLGYLTAYGATNYFAGAGNSQDAARPVLRQLESRAEQARQNRETD